MRRAEIIERLEKADGPDRELDHAIDAMLPTGVPRHVWRPIYTASLDAAIALVERTLPGYIWSVSDGDEHGPNALVHRPDDKSPVGDMAATPAIALLISMFRALEAKEAGNG